MRAPLLAEERRLLVTAMGRARRRLLVTAVDSDAGGGGHEAVLPSAFFSRLPSGPTAMANPSRCSRSRRRACCRLRRW